MTSVHTSATTTPMTVADGKPVADFWNLIARVVRFEPMAISTWWLVAIDSRGRETGLGVAHLDEQRKLICGWSENGKTIIGRHETEFRSILAGVLGEGR